MALVGSYLDRDEFAARTIAPASIVHGDFIDPTGAFTDPVKVQKRVAHRAFVDSQLIIWTSKINARLRKRYAVPFASPISEVVLGWLVAVVTPLVYEKRGWDPSDAQAARIIEAASAAETEMQEAADSETGLYDLPLRQDNPTSAIEPTANGPFVYSEASPYEWMGVQREAVRK